MHGREGFETTSFEGASEATLAGRPLTLRLAPAPRGDTARPNGRSPGASAEPLWWLSAPRGAWVVERTFPVGLRLLQPEVNTFGDLAEVYVRDAAGAWTAHGPWARGAPLPAAGPAAGATSGSNPAPAAGNAPPGWLAAGLPQGVRVLVARLGAGAFLGPDTPVDLLGELPVDFQGRAGVQWLRRTDF